MDVGHTCRQFRVPAVTLWMLELVGHCTNVATSALVLSTATAEMAESRFHEHML